MLVKQQPEICISALLAILLDCKSKLKVLSSVFAEYIHTTFRTTCMLETVRRFDRVWHETKYLCIRCI